MPKLLTIRQTAAILGVHPNTLRLWDLHGTFPAVRLGARHDRRYNLHDVRTLWLTNRRTPSSAALRTRTRPHHIVLDLRHRWSRAATIAVIAGLVIVGNSVTSAQADQSPTQSFSFQDCQGWYGSRLATTIDLEANAGPRAFTAQNAATFDPSLYRVTSAVGQTRGASLDLPDATITCRTVQGLQLPDDTALDGVAVTASFTATAPVNSLASFFLESSTDGEHWTVLQSLPAVTDTATRVTAPIPGTWTIDQLSRLQVRLRPEIDNSADTVAAKLDGLMITTGTASVATPLPSQNRQAKAQLDRLTAFSKSAYESSEQPTISIPKTRTNRLLLWQISQETWEIQSVAVRDLAKVTKTITPRQVDSGTNGNVNTTLFLDMRGFHPGKYTLLVAVRTPRGTVEHIEETFVWGVIAMNVSFAAPRVGLSQQVSMGVLDDAGHTICNAQLKLTVTTPQGKSTTYSTQNKGIWTNPLCIDKGFTEKPDYRLDFPVSQPGLYHLRLEAQTSFGQRVLEENFVAEGTPLFLVERTQYPARIFPLRSYPVRIAVTPNRDYFGIVQEQVPSDFTITGITPFGGTRLDPDNPRQQFVEWFVDWKQGQTYYLTYAFDAPDISPALFLTGPLTIGESFLEGAVFKEPRQWQIASDQITKKTPAELKYETVEDRPADWVVVQPEVASISQPLYRQDEQATIHVWTDGFQFPAYAGRPVAVTKIDVAGPDGVQSGFDEVDDDREQDGRKQRLLYLVPNAQLQPGKYTVTMTVLDGETESTVVKTFEWGTLQARPTAAPFQKDKLIEFTLADTNVSGQMDCQSAMTLTIDPPRGKKLSFSTTAGTIDPPATCNVGTQLDVDRYVARFVPADAGRYAYRLERTTPNRPTTISGTFTVEDRPAASEALANQVRGAVHQAVTNYRRDQTPQISVEVGKKSSQIGRPDTVRTVDAVQVIDPLGTATAVSLIPTEAVQGPATTATYTLPVKQFSRPGKYQIKLTISQDGFVTTVTQDFSWGVLAVNLRRSIERPNTATEIGLAVLDDGGHTLCDAELELTVTDPAGKTKKLSTADASIVQNPNCVDKGVTNDFDYAAGYTTGPVGSYRLHLVAETANGQRSIDDSFQVRDQVDFDIERTKFSMRIWPSANYDQQFTIVANTDYQGPVFETVPAAFGITDISAGGTVAMLGDRQQISWAVDWKTGETHTLGYTIDFPDVSPEYYQLGPLAIGTFQEARQWQIASDATCTMTTGTWDGLTGGGGGGTAVFSSCTGGGTNRPAVTDTIQINNGITLTLTGDGAVAALIFAAGGTGVVAIDSGFSLAVNGAITVTKSASASTQGTIQNGTGNGTVTATSIAVGTAVNPTSTPLTTTLISTINVLTNSGATTVVSTRTSSGSKTNNGTLDIQSGTFTTTAVNPTTASNAASISTVTLANGAASGTLKLTSSTPFGTTGNSGIFTNTLAGGTSTVNYNGTTVTCDANTYTNLQLTGTTSTDTCLPTNVTGTYTIAGGISVALTAAGLTLSGGMTLNTTGTVTGNTSGTYIIGNVSGGLTITAGTLNIGAGSFTVTGTTSVTGTLNDTSNTGTDTFTGAVTVNATGILDISSGVTGSAVTFTAQTITNDSANQFDAGAGTLTLHANPIFAGSGAGGMIFRQATVTIASGSTFTNNITNGTLTFGGGTGLTFANPSVANTLSLTTGSTTSVTGQLLFTANTSGTVKSMVQMNGTANITVGTLTMQQPTGAGSGSVSEQVLCNSGTGTLTVTGALAMTGNSAAAGTAELNMAGCVLSAGATTLTGGGAAAGAAIISSTRTTNYGLIFTNALTFAGTLAKAQLSTTGAVNVKLTGTMSGAGTISGISATTTLETSGTAALGAAYTWPGTLLVGDGSTCTLQNFAITITGLTTVGGGTSGTLTNASGSGLKTFTGGVTVAVGGTFDLSVGTNPAVTFGGTITNNSANQLNAGNGALTFAAAQSLAGNGAGGMLFNQNPYIIPAGTTVTNNMTVGTVTFTALNLASPTTANGLTLSDSSITVVTGTLTYTSNAVAGVNQTITMGNSSGSETLTVGSLIVNKPTNTGQANVACATNNTGVFKVLGTSTLNGASTVAGTVNFTMNTCKFWSVGALNYVAGGSGGNVSVTATTGTIQADAGVSFGGTTPTLDLLTVSGAGRFDLAGTMSAGGTVSLHVTSTTHTTSTTALNGAYTFGILNVDSGTTTMGGVAITIAGATVIANAATLNENSAAGLKTFSGAVTVSADGTFNFSATNPATLFSAGITQSSTNLFNAGSGAAQLVGNLAGSGTGGITFGGTLAINSGTTTNNYTGGTVTVSGVMTFTGGWTQSAGTSFTMGSSNSGTGTFTAIASTNTVTYTGTATMKTENTGHYNTVVINSGANTVTIPAATTTIDNTLTVSGGILSLVGQTFTVTGATSVTGTISTATAATGTKTFSSTVTVQSGGVFDLSGQNPAVTFGGNITQSSNTADSFKAGSGTTTFSASLSLLGAGTGAMNFSQTQVTIPSGVTITNNYTGGTVTFGGATGVAIASATAANGLSLSTGTTTTITNALSFSANGGGNAQTVTMNGTANLNAGSLTINAPTSSGQANVTCASGASGTLAVTGALAMTGGTSTGNVTVDMLTCTLSAAGMTITGNTHATGGVAELKSSTGVLTTTNGLTFAGGADIAKAKLTTSGAGTINLAGTMSGAGTVAINAGTTMLTTGTTAINSTYTLGLLTISSGTTTLGAAMTVAGDLAISASAALTSTAATLSVGGSWNKNATGTFTHSSGTVDLTTTATATITGDTNFFNFRVTGIGAAKTVEFVHGSTTTVSGTWTVNGGAVGTRIVLTRDNTSDWNISAAATAIDYVDVSYSNNTGSTICATHSISTNGGNTGWTVTTDPACTATITVAGTVYQSGAEGSAFNCSGGNNLSLHVSVNGGANVDVTCTDAGGTFSVPGVTDPGGANVPVAVFSDSASANKLTTVTLSSAAATNITGLTLIIGRVVVTQQNATAMTNTLLKTADNLDAGIRYSVVTSGTDNLTVESGLELHVLAGKTFTPGGLVTTTAAATAANPDGDVHVPATAALTMGTNTLAVGGDLTIAGTLTLSATQVTNMTATGSGFTITSGGQSLKGLTFSGGGGWTNSGALTVSEDWTGTAGGFTQTNSTTITVNGSAFSLANGFTWTKATTGANLILENATNLDFTDSNTTKQNLGVVQIGASPGVTKLKTDMSATTVTIPNGDTFLTKGFDVTTTGAFDCQSGCILDLTDTAPNNETDGTIIDVGGDMTINAGATFTSYSNSTIFLNSTTDTNRIFTTGGKALNNVELKNAGATNDDITISGNLDVDGVLTLTDGQVRLDTYDPTVTTAGNVAIASAATLTKQDTGSPTWTFNGSGTSTWSDSAGTTQDLGLVVIDGLTKTVNMITSVRATTLTVTDTFGLASSGFTLTLTGSGQGASRPLIVTGTLNEGTDSTVDFIGTGTSDIERESYWNLSVRPGADGISFHANGSGTMAVLGNLSVGNGSNTGTFNLDTNDPTVDVDGNITINASGTLVASATGTFNVGGNWDNNATFTHSSGTVTFDAADTDNTIECGSSPFGGLTLASSDASATWTVQTNNCTVAGTLDISAGDILTITTVILTHTGGTFNFPNTATIDGTGTLLFTSTSAGPGTTGTLSALVRFDATSADVGTGVVDARTYGGAVEFYSNVAATRSITLPSGSFTFSSTFTTIDGTSQTSAFTVDASNGGLSNPTVAITGNLTFSKGAGAVTPELKTGTGTWTLSGDLDSRNGTFTATSGNVVIMAGDGKIIYGDPGLTLDELTIDTPAPGTIWNGASPFYINDQLTVASGDTLGVGVNSILLLKTSGTSLTLAGTLDNANGTLYYYSTTAFPTGGFINCKLYMDASSGDQALSARTYGGIVYLGNSHASSARVTTLGTTGGQTLTFSTHLYLEAPSGGNITMDGAAYDPVISVAGDLDFIGGGGGTEIILAPDVGGGKTWTLAGNVNLTDGTYTKGTETLDLTGSGKTLTSDGETLNNLTLTGSITLANQNHNVGGNLVLAGTITAGTSTVTMTGSGKNITGGGQTLNNLTLDGNGTTTLQTSGIFISGVLNVTTSDTLDFGSLYVFLTKISGASLTLDGTIAGSGNFFYSTDTAFPTGGFITSPLIMLATDTDQALSARSYGGSVKIVNAHASIARTVTLGTAADQTIDITGNLIVEAGGAADVTVQGATWDPILNVGVDLDFVGIEAGTEHIIAPDVVGGKNWTVSGYVNFTDGTYTKGTETLVMNGTGTLTSASQTLNNLTINSASTVILAQATHTMTGNLVLGGAGTPTVTNSTISMTGSGKSITGGGKILNNLTLDGGGTTTLQTSDLTVAGTLNVTTGDTLTIDTGRTLTHTGATLTLAGTINNTAGSGTLVYQSATAFPTGGIMSADLRMDATNNSQTLGGSRTFGGDVELYNNSAASNRTVDLGTAGSQTLTFSGNLILTAANTKNINMNGSGWDPIINVAGDFSASVPGGGAAVVDEACSQTWTFSGNLDLDNVTWNYCGVTVKMNGTGGKTLDGGNNILGNLTIDPASAATITLLNSDLRVDAILSVAAGDTLAIDSGRTLSHTGGTFTFPDTAVISGAGTLRFTSASPGPGMTGTLTSVVRFDASSVDIASTTVDARTGANSYGGAVQFYANNALGRTITLPSGTMDFDGAMTIEAAGAGTLNVTGATNDPAYDLEGNFTMVAGGGVETFTTGSGNWNAAGSVDLTNGTYTTEGTHTLIMDGSGTLTSDNETLLNLTLSGTIILADATHTIAGSLSMSGGTITAGSSTISMTGSGKTINGGSQTLNNLTLDGNGTTTLQTEGLTVSGILNVTPSDTLTITGSGVILSHTGGTFTFPDTATIGGTGSLRFTSTSPGPGTTGTLSSVVRYDATTGDIPSTTIDARTYGGTVLIFSNTATAREVTLPSGTMDFNGALTLASGSGTLNLNGATNDPTYDLEGNFTMDPAPGVETFTTGSGNWNAAGSVNLSNGTYTTEGTHTLIMDGTGTLTSDNETLLNLTIAGTNVTLADATHTMTGNLVLGGTTITPGSSTISMTGSGKTITGGGKTLNNLTLANDGTTTLQTSDLTVSGTLNVTSSDTLVIDTSRTLTHSGATLTLDGTIDNTTGSGTLEYQSTTAFPTGGVMSADLRMNPVSGNQTLSNRTYAEDVELYNNAGVSRTHILGTGTVDIDGALSLNANSGNLIVDGTTNDSAMTLTSDLTCNASAATETINAPDTGTPTWTMSGNVNLTNCTYVKGTETLAMDGSAKVITAAGNSVGNFTVSGGSITQAGALTVAGIFAESAGAFTQAASNDLLLTGSAMTLDASTTFTKASDTGKLILDGNPLELTDSNAVKQDLGNVVIGASPSTTNLNSDHSASSLTIPTTDTYNSRGWDVDVSGALDCQGSCTLDMSDHASAAHYEHDGSIITVGGNFTMSSSGTFTQDANAGRESKIYMKSGGGAGTNRTVATGGKPFQILQLENAGSTNDNQTISGNLTVNGAFSVTDGEADFTTNDPTVDFNGSVAISSGAILTASNVTDMAVAGNWTNNGTFTDGGGSTKVTFDGTAQQTLSGTMTGSSDFNDVMILNSSGTDPDTSPSVIFTDSATTAGTFAAVTDDSNVNVKVRFDSASTYTLNSISLQGTNSIYQVYLHSSTPGSATTFNAGAGSRTVTFASIKDNNACGSSGGEIDASGGTNTDEGNNTCWFINTLTVSLSATSANLGTLDANNVSQAGITSTVTTNAATGYVSLVKYDQTLTAGTFTIPDTSGTTIIKGESEYGAASSQTGNTIAQWSPAACSTTATTSNATALSTSFKSFASKASAASSEVTTLCLLASTTATQAPGAYASTLTIVTTARF